MLEGFCNLLVKFLVGFGLDHLDQCSGIGQVREMVVITVHELHPQLIFVRTVTKEAEQPLGGTCLDLFYFVCQACHIAGKVQACTIVIIYPVVGIQLGEFKAFIKILVNCLVSVLKSFFHHQDGWSHIESVALLRQQVAAPTDLGLLFKNLYIVSQVSQPQGGC